MKNTIIYLLLASIYFLLTGMSCEKERSIIEEEVLVRIEVSNVDNSGKNMIVTEKYVAKEAYVIAVKCFAKVVDADQELKYSDDEIELSMSYYFINTEPEVSVISNNHFNSKYPPGSDVSKLFTKTVKHYLNGYSYVLVLKQAPDAGVHSFKVVYKLIDSEDTIEADTQAIELL